VTTYTIRHGFYGCETGCCGTQVEADDGGEKFEFGEPEFIPSTDEERREVLEDVMPGVWKEGDTIEFEPAGWCHIRSNRDLMLDLKGVRKELAHERGKSRVPPVVKETSLKRARQLELDSVVQWLDMLLATCAPGERAGVSAAIGRVVAKRAQL
jgi:hypothetical protein